MPSAIGIDIGTSSARALLVCVETGQEIASSVSTFVSGSDGLLTDPNNAYLVRQQPSDYRIAVTQVIRGVVEKCDDPNQIIGIGLDATASTPLPVLSDCRALADENFWKDNINALAWLWKDHTAVAESEEITHLARAQGRPYLSKCGGVYSSEWFWSKALKCARMSPDVLDAADTWMESIDWVVAWLTGCKDSRSVTRNVCAAGHKGLYCHEWGGWPDDEFLRALDYRLVKLKNSLPRLAQPAGVKAGILSQEIADATGLPSGISVSVGLIDAHAGAIGCGVREGALVKIIGTSACEILVAPDDGRVGEIIGISGIVKGSVIPGMLGIEAGQAAVGDLFDWFVNKFCTEQSHEDLTQKATTLKVGESGLVALDWNNGCRSVLSDQSLTGLLIGQTLATQPHEVYRTLIEATAFGARKIVERLTQSGAIINEVVTCGGVAEKNPLLLQIYSDVLKLPIRSPKTNQACALGSAIFGAVVGGGHKDVNSAIRSMTAFNEHTFVPLQENVIAYDRIYKVYESLYDTFGVSGEMKELIAIRETARKLKLSI